MSARVLLLTGPSGSGKTSLLRRVGATRLNLDQFYRDGAEPGMPLLDGAFSGAGGVSADEAMSRIDWDHPAAWDDERAMTAIRELCTRGRTRVPVYSLSDNATRGHQDLDIGGAGVFVAEGIFAAELVGRCRSEGLLADALVLRRPRPAAGVPGRQEDRPLGGAGMPPGLTPGVRDGDRPGHQRAPLNPGTPSSG